AGGAAIAQAIGTDAWTAAKQGMARIFGRRDEQRGREIEAELDRSSARLQGLSGADLTRELIDQEAVWRTRLEDLLRDDPEAAASLAEMIGQLLPAAAPASSAGPVRQIVIGLDSARQAVQGHGLQVNRLDAKDET